MLTPAQPVCSNIIFAACGRGDIAVADDGNSLYRLRHGADARQVDRAAESLLARPAMHKNGGDSRVLQRARQIRRRQILVVPPPPVKKHLVTKKGANHKTPPGPTVEDQIQALRQEMQGQINSLKNDLATKDEELKSARHEAEEARAAADRAAAAASSENQAVVENTTAVSSLQSTVTDLKGNQVSLANTVSDETAKIKKEINSPGVLHYKGIEQYDE